MKELRLLMKVKLVTDVEFPLMMPSLEWIIKFEEWFKANWTDKWCDHYLFLMMPNFLYLLHL